MRLLSQTDMGSMRSGQGFVFSRTSILRRREGVMRVEILLVDEEPAVMELPDSLVPVMRGSPTHQWIRLSRTGQDGWLIEQHWPAELEVEPEPEIPTHSGSDPEEIAPQDRSESTNPVLECLSPAFWATNTFEEAAGRPPTELEGKLAVTLLIERLRRGI